MNGFRGLWFEECEPGRTVEHALRRTVTEMDNVLFSSLTLNFQRVHLDAEYAQQTEFGKCLMNSMFTLGLVVGMTVPELTHGTVVANLGFESIEFPKPVFAGDTVRVRSEVLAARPSRSRSDAGVVTFAHEGLNQRDEVVVRCQRTALMQRERTDAA